MLALFGQWVTKADARNIYMQQADILDLESQLPQGWDGYDFIVSSAMLEYIPKNKVGQALGNLRRLLSEKGNLLVFVTKRTWIAEWTGGKWWKTNLFDPDELETYLHQAGFNTVEFKQMPAAWDAFMLAVEAKSSS
jgi:cyclopropane fatty-acyl-phospholipid synthase-like methyltransferase